LVGGTGFEPVTSAL